MVDAEPHISMQIDPEFLTSNVAVHATLRGLVSAPVHIRLEGLNVAGSIKLTPALRMVMDLETSGRLSRGSHVIESSSGNLGVALSVICAARGYPFTCVTDPNASAQACKAMEAAGAKVIIVDQRDQNGGFLNTRIELIRQLCARDPTYVWINQYANESNWLAHYSRTAREILTTFHGKVDWLLVGAGTTGTLMGCGRFFKEHSPATRVIAIDAAGSVIFGQPPAKRYIPGIGATRTPEILDTAFVDEVVYVDEMHTIRMCRALALCGLLVGGSTGSVLAGAELLTRQIGPDDTIVAISADMADKYLDTIYNDQWVNARFPAVS